MKIWILLSEFGLGGLERVQANIAPALTSSGMDVMIVAGRFAAGAEELLPPEVRILSLAPAGVRGFVPSLIRHLRSHQPDVVITTSNDVACLLLILRYLIFPDLRVVCTQHSSISGPLYRAKGAKRLKLSLLRWLSRLLLPKAESIVCVSKELANDVRRTLGLTCKIEVIHNPILLPDFSSQLAEPIAWPWDDYAIPTVIFVGRLSGEKRLDLVLRAFQSVLSILPCRLLILGDGPLRNEVERLITELELENHSFLAGFHPNPFPWISRAELLVLPSDYEGFGNVLVEAMACGVQVVATDCPNGPAEVLNHGKYGQLIPTNNVEALAGAILRSLRAEFLKHPDVLIKRAHEFNVAQAAKHYLDVIHAAVKE